MPIEALEEEITSINAIYDPSTVEIVSDDASGTVATLRLPEKTLSFLISFPDTYPEVPPRVNGTASVAGHHKGEGKAAVQVLQDIIGRVWAPGQVCLFDLIEEAGSLLAEETTAQDQSSSNNNHNHNGPTGHDTEAGKASEEKFGALDPNSLALNDLVLDPRGTILPPGISAPKWILSEPLVVNKSTFLAHCVACNTKSVASAYITHLLSTNKKVASATHNISAWRLKEPDTGVTFQDCDDDGETAAGGRLLHLMQLMDVWNAVVVVTRWYGGVKLGPERFRCINGVAREALINGGFAKEEKAGNKKGKK